MRPAEPQGKAAASRGSAPDGETLLQQHAADLERRLEEAEQTLEAIRNGEVDAVIVSGTRGQQVYTLESADRPYRILIEEMLEGAITLGDDGTVLYCNRCLADMLDSPLERIVGSRLDRFVAEGHRPVLERLIQEGHRGRAKREIDLLDSAGGLVPAQVSLVSLPSGGVDSSRVLCGVVTDLREIRMLEEQLRLSQKMDAIGQLTGGVAHDFNNLLMAVLSNLDLLRKRYGADPSARRLLEGAIEGAKRGAALTQRLLAFARKQDLRSESVDIAALLHGMRDLLQRSAGPLVTLQMDTEDDLPPAQVDANQLELALLNLVLNASDAMPRGGRLTITLRRVKAGGERAGEPKPGDYLRLTVADTGTGMDAATLRQAIEPFFSTKGTGKGTGLGLSMVHGLASQLGGALLLSSMPGAGTTAELWLPVATAPKRASRPAPAHSPSPAPEAPATILVVDDDALIAMSTAEMLRDLGHRVIEAHSGAQALDILLSEPEVDILLTDQAMPGMRGSELARLAREARPELSVLLATGYTDLGEERADVPCLSKPYVQDELADAIAKLRAASMQPPLLG